MKKVLLLVCILLQAASLYSQEYHKMVKEGNKWNYLVFLGGTIGNGDYMTSSLSLTKDTVIGDRAYKKVMCTMIGADEIYPAYYGGALREDEFSQQVFLKLPDKEEKMIYSFVHQVGDTIAVDTLKYDKRMSYVEYSIRTVKSVETIELNNIKRKRIEIADSTYIKSASAEWEPFETHRDYWYEGLGSTEHVFIPIRYEIVYDKGLLCFWERDNQIYHNSLGYGCEYAENIKTGIAYDSNSSIVEIYPNPTIGRFRVKSNVPVWNITITDQKGTAIVEQKEDIEVDISCLSTGIYLAKIQTVESMVVKKIVKY